LDSRPGASQKPRWITAEVNEGAPKKLRLRKDIFQNRNVDRAGFRRKKQKEKADSHASRMVESVQGFF
jgi:hypothetical protein